MDGRPDCHVRLATALPVRAGGRRLDPGFCAGRSSRRVGRPFGGPRSEPFPPFTFGRVLPEPFVNVDPRPGKAGRSSGRRREREVDHPQPWRPRTREPSRGAPAAGTATASHGRRKRVARAANQRGAMGLSRSPPTSPTSWRLKGRARRDRRQRRTRDRWRTYSRDSPPASY